MTSRRIHWAVTITALALAVLGPTRLGSATVESGVAAAKAPLFASGVIKRGPPGPRGRRGPRGLKGPIGDPGDAGPGGALVIAQATQAAAIVTSLYPGTDDTLTGNTWTQVAAETDVAIGSITYDAPAVCNTFGMSFLNLYLFVDGAQVVRYQKFFTSVAGGTTSFALPLRFAPGTDTDHTLTAKVADFCNSGGHFMITGLKLDVVGVE